MLIEEHDKDDESSVDSFTHTQFPVDAIRANDGHIINDPPTTIISISRAGVPS